MNEELLEVIQSVPKRDWQEFFQTLKQKEYQAIGNLTLEQLTAVQERVNMIAELERLFTTGIHQPKPNQ